MRFAAYLCAGLLGLVPALAGEQPTHTSHPVVVELFTSQGCADCPPADAFLGELAKRRNTIAITLPVTYWDMLGWKDTFASEANTTRQKAYAKALGRSGVYTPQMIVNGTADVVGGRRDQVLSTVAARANDNPSIPVDIQLAPHTVNITIAGGEKTGPATIWVMPTLSRANVKVGKGENQGRELAYTNIVRDLKAIGVWEGEAVTFSLPRRALTKVRYDGLVVLLQRDRHGQVIGATMIGKRVPE
ncbi:MAG: DUF1223 domain-containing protein [Alphaproteobacteria bacterium]